MNRWRVCDKCGEHHLANKPCPVCNNVLTVEDLTAEFLRRSVKAIEQDMAVELTSPQPDESYIDGCKGSIAAIREEFDNLRGKDEQ